MAIVINNAFKVQLLLAKRPLLRTLELRLYQAPILITGNSVLADFTEATYPGYARRNLLWILPPFRRPDGIAQQDSEPILNKMTGAIPVNTLYGYYFVTPGGFFAFGGAFAAGPQRFNHLGAEFTFSVRFLEDSMR